MVALGLFGCVEATGAFEVNVKFSTLFFCEVIKGFILLMQRNLAFHDFFCKVGRFEFKFSGCYFVRCDIVYMYCWIEFITQRR